MAAGKLIAGAIVCWVIAFLVYEFGLSALANGTSTIPFLAGIGVLVIVGAIALFGVLLFVIGVIMGLAS